MEIRDQTLAGWADSLRDGDAEKVKEMIVSYLSMFGEDKKQYNFNNETDDDIIDHYL